MTVLQGYRFAVHAHRPNARLVVTTCDGARFYQIKDGDEELSRQEVGPTIAWREAGYRLCNPHSAAAWA